MRRGGPDPWALSGGTGGRIGAVLVGDERRLAITKVQLQHVKDLLMVNAGWFRAQLRPRDLRIGQIHWPIKPLRRRGIGPFLTPVHRTWDTTIWCSLSALKVLKEFDP